MGLLDEAIREHLDLKRRHGADEDEIARQEAEAFGAEPIEEEEEPFAGFEATREPEADPEMADDSSAPYDRAAEAGLTGTRDLPEFEWHGSTSDDIEVPSFVLEELDADAGRGTPQSGASESPPDEAPASDVPGPQPEGLSPGEAPEPPPADAAGGQADRAAPPAPSITDAPTEAFTPVDAERGAEPSLGHGDLRAGDEPFDEIEDAEPPQRPVDDQAAPTELDTADAPEEASGGTEFPPEQPDVGEELAQGEAIDPSTAFAPYEYEEETLYGSLPDAEAEAERFGVAFDEPAPQADPPGERGLEPDPLAEEAPVEDTTSAPAEAAPEAPLSYGDLGSVADEPQVTSGAGEEQPLGEEPLADESLPSAELMGDDEPAPLHEDEAVAPPFGGSPETIFDEPALDEAALEEEAPLDAEPPPASDEPLDPAAPGVAEEEPHDPRSARGFFEDTQQHEGIRREQGEGRDPDFEG